MTVVPIRESAALKLGRPGACVIVGACPGRHEEKEGRPFSPNGDSGRKLRALCPEFDDATLINVSVRARYAPRDTRFQPTVAECLADGSHTALLRRVLADARVNGSKVRVIGAVSRDVLKRLGINFDEEMPHPSGRNYRWWKWLRDHGK
jgi:hypothetical protein